MTLSEMIEATVKDAGQYGAFMEFDKTAWEVLAQEERMKPSKAGGVKIC